MWKCHKCGKPVYFAERKQSLGYDWHPECLRCEECGKRLNPGQHAEHKGVPYCHVPCYGALFGPQLFGHGTRVESHTSFGQQRTASMARTQLESKLKVFNQFYDGRSSEIKSREVNGRLVLEGALRIHWGVQGVIHLKEDDDQRTVVTVRKRNSCRFNHQQEEEEEQQQQQIELHSHEDSVDGDGDGDGSDLNDKSSPNQSPFISPRSLSLTLPPKLDVQNIGWDELDDLLQVERYTEDSNNKPYQTLPTALSVAQIMTATNGCSCKEEEIEENVTIVEPQQFLSRSMSGPDCLERTRSSINIEDDNDDINKDTDATVTIRNKGHTGSTAIKRRPGGKRRSRAIKLKRRCSINGHFYNRETSFFTPPFGSQTSVWVTSLVSTNEVINLMLEKYKVDSRPDNFALFIIRDNGEQRRIRDDEYPLLVRVLLGPHEDVSRLFIMDRHSTPEVSNEVAQFLNLSLTECRAILEQYRAEEEREIGRVQDKYDEMKKRIKQRMDELKVRL